jgi:hypothetical protein
MKALANSSSGLRFGNHGNQSSFIDDETLKGLG